MIKERYEKINIKARRLAARTLKKRKKRAYAGNDELERTLLDIAKKQTTGADWMELDNAALIFPSSDTADFSNMFRVSALLTEKVDPVILQEAVNLIVPRFPSLTSSMKKGLFWYYLEPSDKPLVVEKLHDFPCRKLDMNARNALVRITYYDREIAAEIYHAAADGNVGITFLNSLIGCYFKLKGEEIKDRTNCLNHLDKPKPEELEDSYQRFYDKEKHPRAKEKHAYTLKGKKLPAGTVLTVSGILPAEKTHAVAKERGLTVGQLITAVLISAIEDERAFRLRKGKHPVIVGVPLNLRKFTESRTLRNFVALMHVEGNESLDFDVLCKSVREQFIAGSDIELLKGYVNFNVNAQRLPLLRIMPLPVKNIALRIAMALCSDNVKSSTFSNLGVVSAPEEFKDKVVRYGFFLGVQPTVLDTLGGVTYNDKLVLTFARGIEESDVEKYFFRRLSALGIPVAVETNFEGL